MSTGQHPFAELDASHVAAAILHRSPVPPSSLNPKVSAELERIILKCLEKDPKNRYQSAKDLALADEHGFSVVETYSDIGISGLTLRKRPGLRQLLEDVIAGQTKYKAILVSDVSRWGRFQDTDEAAHYEFLCKAAKIAVHYCAEPFAEDCGDKFSWHQLY